MNYRLNNIHVNSFLLNVVKPLAVDSWFERPSSDNFALNFYTYVSSQVSNFMFVDGWYKREYSDYVNASKYILSFTSKEHDKELRNVKFFRDCFNKVYSYYLQDVGVFLLKQSIKIQERVKTGGDLIGLSNIVTAVPKVLYDGLGVYYVNDIDQIGTKEGFCVVSKEVLKKNSMDILDYLNDDFVSKVIGNRDDFSSRLVKSVCSDEQFSELAFKGMLYIYLAGKNTLAVIDELEGGEN